MEKRLKLYTLDGGNNVIPFPNSDNQIEIGDFRYDAKRMGASPTISATVMYESCLDEVWNENVFAEFNGERYYLKSTPTSSYSNEDERYRHELELVSERVILDNVYFYDAVVANVASDDKPKSNSTKVVFSGTIHEFVRRLNSSLAYSGLQTVDSEGNYVSGYRAIVDESVTDEETQFMSFEDQFFSNVIQEIYNTYNLPYYFKGKEIHIGFEDTVIQDTLEYGVDNALLSITKQNANFKIVNRATGKGSSDNIPYYYPNLSPKGELSAESSNSSLDVTIINAEKYASAIEIDKEIEYKAVETPLPSNTTIVSREDTITKPITSKIYNYAVDYTFESKGEFGFNIDLLFPSTEDKSVWETSNIVVEFYRIDGENETLVDDYRYATASYGEVSKNFTMEVEASTYRVKGSYTLRRTDGSVRGTNQFKLTIASAGSFFGWTKDDKAVKLNDLGLRIEGAPSNGDTITQRLVKKVDTSDVLLPSIYRATDGKQRFYNAVNANYTDEGYLVDLNLGDYKFPSPYNGHNPKEHIVEVSDIKPTIKGATYNGVPIDRFLEFAYDEDDNNETYEDEEGSTNYKHSYFFAKLPPLGFNLFDHSIEQQPMVISFTSGQCAACEFEIAVSEAEEGETRQYNLVQVDSNGNLQRDPETGRVICGIEDFQSPVEPQEIQNDTTSNSVWIALRKEESTFGHLMPFAPDETNSRGYRPTSEDTFVILGIHLPLQYILNAEKKLEEEIIKYLKENNEEKFNFSINFSRIYFEENPGLLALLNENSRLNILYDGKTYTLYVSSFSYNMSQDEVLPQITVELDDELTITQNALQNAISQVKSDVGKALGSIDVLGLATPYFLRKDADDEARGKINFKKGVKFGEGGKVEIFDNNSAKLTIEYLEVTKKATFTSLEIQERTHVGGQLLVTPAALNCGEVEEFEDYYRCYFQTKGENRDEIFNQFVVGDQAICQTFNAWGSRYYWRLVVGVGEDYIDLSKSDYDEYSDTPMEGDKIVQFGNRDNEERQNAIVLAAHGEGSPYFIQYQGIDSYEVPEDKVVTKLSPYGNLITGKVVMKSGSTLTKSDGTTETLEEALAKAGEVTAEDLATLEEYVDSQNALLQSQIDGAISTWFYDPEPTLNNAPANEWTTDEAKNIHLGDLYYSATGKAYRFQLSNGVYSWVLIEDEDISKALANAQRAQETADGKMQVFVSQPIAPYQIGDIWVQGEGGDILRSVVNRTSGYDASDWVPASKYTDDTTANQAIAKAENAQEELVAINTTLGEWASDGTISPTEKTALKDKQKEVAQEYRETIAELNKYENYIDSFASVKQAYVDAFTKADTAFIKYTASTPESITIESDYGDIASYYSVLADTLLVIAEAAQRYAETKASELIDNIEVGGNNLLRNTGFTGDYLSEQLTDEKVLETTTEMYSPWYDHWTYTSGISVINLEGISLSGKGVQFDSSTNTLSQTPYFTLVTNATYMVSFKARSTATKSEVTINVGGGQSVTIAISSSWSRYVTQVTTGGANSFSISGSSLQLCEVQLERGNKATAWKPSPLDNGSDRAYWQSMKYLQGAIEASSTVVNGGLVLSTIIGVGEHINEDTGLDETTGGMSGIRNNDNDVAFWAGGSFPQAIEAVSKFINNPSYQPTGAELAEMAKFVVTHGGRAILNDIILRGIVYATGGRFFGEIEAEKMKLKVATPSDSRVIDGSFITLDSGIYVLPQLERGQTMTVEAVAFILTKVQTYTTFVSENSSVKISLNGNFSSPSSLVTSLSVDAFMGPYRMIGFGASDTETYWGVYRMITEYQM